MGQVAVGRSADVPERYHLLFLIALTLTIPSNGWARPALAKQQAKALFKAAKAAYAAKDYKEAAAKFTAAFELDPQPAALLNIAQSYRSGNDYEMAARYYQRFLDAAPTSSLKTQVEELLREAKAKIEVRKKPVLVSPPRPTPPTVPTPTPAPRSIHVAPAPPLPIYRRWWFWTTIAAVLVGTVGVSVYAGTRDPDYVKEGGLGSVRW